MDRPNTIQLPVQTYPKPNLTNDISMAPKCAAVEMCPFAEKVGTILLPDRVGGRLRPDAGWVLAVGEGIDLEIGDVVLVMPYKGDRYQPFYAGYETEGEVRLYGISSPNEFTHVKEGAYQGIRGKLVEGKIEAIGHWVLIRRDPVETSVLGFELPDDDQFRSGKATVVSSKTEWEEGARIMYRGNAIVTDFDFLDRPEYKDFVGEYHPSDFVFIHEDDVFCQIRDEVAA